MLLNELTQAFGVSGYEKEIRDVIKNEIKDDADEIIVDAIGNLIAYKKGSGENKKKIMLAAHMDEIGMQVKKIEDDGKIKVKPLGYLWLPVTYMNRVKFRNGITGIVTSTVLFENVKNDFNKLYIEIGARTKEEAQKYVKIGDVIGYVGEYEELLGGNVTAKALDNRIGCYMMIETMKKINHPVNDLFFVFTVQEELGCRGAKAAANRIKPDIGIAVDVTPAHDYPCDLEGSNTLGGGTAIKVSDPSVICDEELVEKMVKCCEDNDIKYQLDVIDRGGTDAGSINLSNDGVKALGVSVATRNAHGPNAVVNMNDALSSIELLSKFLNKKI